MVLVDTSVWVSHLRAAVPGLRSLLADGEVVCHPLVVGELACGNLGNRVEILGFLRQLPKAIVAQHDEAMAFIERHSLAGKGIGFIDVHLLASAKLTGVPLWTTDRRLREIAVEMDSSYQ